MSLLDIFLAIDWSDIGLATVETLTMVGGSLLFTVISFVGGLVLGTIMALMKAGEHIVASRSIFGATQQLLGNILYRQFIAPQVVNRQIPAQVVFEFLKTRPFFAQVPAQGLWAHVQLLGNGIQIRPVAAVAAE